jgi:hypothetical protein
VSKYLAAVGQASREGRSIRSVRHMIAKNKEPNAEKSKMNGGGGLVHVCPHSKGKSSLQDPNIAA